MRTLNLTRRSQLFTRDKRTRAVWKTVTKPARFKPGETALLICDVWDTHPLRGARERMTVMLPRMNRLAKHLRRKGVLIIHSPSECMGYYKDHPARLAVLATPPANPRERRRADPPMPFSTEISHSDTGDVEPKMPPFPWTRENKAIEIRDEDAISSNGREIYSLMKARGIKHLLFMGVHTNFCVLHRSFGIKQMVKWGVDAMLVRDLTDGLYDPATPPYVSHDEGTQLVIGYIEKFWCATVESKELLQ
jgi:nicotinamidase-related amidase